MEKLKYGLIHFCAIGNNGLCSFKKINAVYSLERTVLENVDNIKYLGVAIFKDLKWNIHVCKQCLHKSKQNTWFLKT